MTKQYIFLELFSNNKIKVDYTDCVFLRFLLNNKNYKLLEEKLK